MSVVSSPEFSVTLAAGDEDVRAAQRLRYDVFVEELGGGGMMVDHDARLEQDRFDPFFDHLILRDERLDRVVGVYRVMRQDQAVAAGSFYSASEYDLSPLINSGRKLLELGRSCVHRDYRGGGAMFHLWTALAEYVARHDIEILFGVASFHGRDVCAPVAAQLARGGPVPGEPVSSDALLVPDWPDELWRVAYVDRYGNAISGVRAAAIDAGAVFTLNGHTVHGARTFTDVSGGEAFWYENSNGLLEFAVNRGRADEVLGLMVGAEINS